MRFSDAQLDAIVALRETPDPDHKDAALDTAFSMAPVTWPDESELASHHLPPGCVAVKMTWTPDRGDEDTIAMRTRLSRTLILNRAGETLVDTGVRDVTDYGL